MTKNILTLIIIFAVMLAIVLLGFLLAYAKKKGWKLGAVGAEVEKDIDIAESLATALIPFLPAPYNGIIAALCKYVSAAVDQVKKLYDINIVTADQRKATAIQLIEDDLKTAGITVDDNVTKLIDLLIEDIYQIPKLAAPAPQEVVAPASTDAK